MTHRQVRYLSIALLITYKYAFSSEAMKQPKIAPVAIYTAFENPARPLLVESMEEEVEAILSPLALPVVWRTLPADSGNNMAAELAIVRFRGECDGGLRIFHEKQSGPLGWTYSNKGTILAFADIDCNQIRDMLQDELRRFTPPDGDVRLGRAAARVLAHELFHIFARTARHASDGVAKSFLSKWDLTTAEFHFQPEELRVMRASMSQARRALREMTGETGPSPAIGGHIYAENGCANCHGSHGQGSKRGPALRGKETSTDARSLAERLTKSWEQMCGNARGRQIAPPSLEEDEIDDLVSFLKQME